MDEHPNLPPLLKKLAWARLASAGLLLGAGGLLALWLPLPFPFLPFALCLMAAAVVSSACLAVLPRITRLRRFAWLQLVTDILLITAVVIVTGGSRSVFSFLYVLSITSASLILSRRGGMVIGGLASLLYSGVVLTPAITPLDGLFESHEAAVLNLLAIFTNVGAFMAVAVLTGALAERLRSIRVAMEDQGKNLENLQAFKDLIFQSVGSGLIAMDTTRRITAFNRAAEEITGFSAADAVGQPWEAIFGDEISLDSVWVPAAGEGRQARRHEIRHRLKNGSEVPLGISFWPLRSGEGALRGMVGICQDLTGIKRMERRMRETDRLAAIGRLAANIAHEIRNPLASLSGAIEVMAREPSADGSRERLAEIVLKESDRLNQIITEFLKYARPAPLQRQPVNVADILDEVLLLLEQRPLPDALKVVKEYQHPLAAHLDPQQMKQALWNLCLNAAEAMPDGGELRVRARAAPRERPERIEISVSDTGAGVRPSDLPHIYEPFFSTKTKGSGLGLALVHRTVQDHGGEIEARSEPGAGTTFRLTLPLTLPSPPAGGEDEGEGA